MSLFPPVSTCWGQPAAEFQSIFCQPLPSPPTHTSPRSFLPGLLGDDSRVTLQKGADAVILLPLWTIVVPAACRLSINLQDPRYLGILVVENLEKLHSFKNEISVVVRSLF